MKRPENVHMIPLGRHPIVGTVKRSELSVAWSFRSSTDPIRSFWIFVVLVYICILGPLTFIYVYVDRYIDDIFRLLEKERELKDREKTYDPSALEKSTVRASKMVQATDYCWSPSETDAWIVQSISTNAQWMPFSENRIYNV